jgi:hypothetical protein
LIPVDIEPDGVANGTACHRSDRAGKQTLRDCDGPLSSLSQYRICLHHRYANTDPRSGKEKPLHE